MGSTGSGAGTVSGKDDAMPPSAGQTGVLPPPRVDPSDTQAPNQPPQGSTVPVQQQ
jgi:hypothetical protein